MHTYLPVYVWNICVATGTLFSQEVGLYSVMCAAFTGGEIHTFLVALSIKLIRLSLKSF